MIRLKREEIFKEHTLAADANTRQKSQTHKNDMNSANNNDNDNDKLRCFPSTSLLAHPPLLPSRIIRTSTSTITTPPSAVQNVAQAHFKMLSTSAIISTPTDEQGKVDMLIHT